MWPSGDTHRSRGARGDHRARGRRPGPGLPRCGRSRSRQGRAPPGRDRVPGRPGTDRRQLRLHPAALPHVEPRQARHRDRAPAHGSDRRPHAARHARRPPALRRLRPAPPHRRAAAAHGRHRGSAPRRGGRPAPRRRAPDRDRHEHLGLVMRERGARPPDGHLGVDRRRRGALRPLVRDRAGPRAEPPARTQALQPGRERRPALGRRPRAARRALQGGLGHHAGPGVHGRAGGPGRRKGDRADLPAARLRDRRRPDAHPRAAGVRRGAARARPAVPGCPRGSRPR